MTLQMKKGNSSTKKKKHSRGNQFEVVMNEVMKELMSELMSAQFCNLLYQTVSVVATGKAGIMLPRIRNSATV